MVNDNLAGDVNLFYGKEEDDEGKIVEIAEINVKPTFI